jgi:hypothetical protein
MPFIVKANSDTFALSFATPEDIFSFETLEYNNGYLVSDYDGTKGILRHYNYDGELDKEIELDTGRLAPNMFIIDNELYVLTSAVTGANAHILKFDEEYNIVKDANLNKPFFNSPLFSAYMSFVEQVGDTISIWYRDDSKLLVINKDLETIQLLDATTANRELYAPGLLNRSKLYNPMYPYYPSAIGGAEFMYNMNNYYMGVKATKTCDSDNVIYYFQTGDDDSVLFEDCYYLTFDVYDDDMTMLWSQDIEGYESIYNAKVVGDYLVAIGVKSTGYTAFIYDMTGNLVQTIDNEYGVLFSYINEIENGFALADRCGVYNDAPDPNCYSRHYIYLFNNVIETTSEGKGNVTVPENAIVGEKVTINIEPEEGYVLGELKVIDEEGKEIPIENNTFIMGLTKVTIIATFVPVNPANPITGNHSIFLFSILAIACGFLFVAHKRRLKYLK